VFFFNCSLHIKVIGGERDFQGFKFFMKRDGVGTASSGLSKVSGR